MTDHLNHGTSLDDFLSEEGILEEATTIANSRVNDWKQRVFDEKNLLDTKIDDLNKFINENTIFTVLELNEQLSMRQQLSVMKLYSTILGERIARFGVSNG